MIFVSAWATDATAIKQNATKVIRMPYPSFENSWEKQKTVGLCYLRRTSLCGEQNSEYEARLKLLFDLLGNRHDLPPLPLCGSTRRSRALCAV